MTGISFHYRWVKTVAGTPNSRDNTGARAPLMSHATARPRQAGTSFESQAQQRAGRRKPEPGPPGPLNATSQAHCHPGQARNAYQQLGGIVRVPTTMDVTVRDPPHLALPKLRDPLIMMHAHPGR